MKLKLMLIFIFTIFQSPAFAGYELEISCGIFRGQNQFFARGIHPESRGVYALGGEYRDRFTRPFDNFSLPETTITGGIRTKLLELNDDMAVLEFLTESGEHPEVILGNNNLFRKLNRLEIFNSQEVPHISSPSSKYSVRVYLESNEPGGDEIESQFDYCSIDGAESYYRNLPSIFLP